MRNITAYEFDEWLKKKGITKEEFVKFSIEKKEALIAEAEIEKIKKHRELLRIEVASRFQRGQTHRKIAGDLHISTALISELLKEAEAEGWWFGRK